MHALDLSFVLFRYNWRDLRLASRASVFQIDAFPFLDNRPFPIWAMARYHSTFTVEHHIQLTLFFFFHFLFHDWSILISNFRSELTKVGYNLHLFYLLLTEFSFPPSPRESGGLNSTLSRARILDPVRWFDLTCRNQLSLLYPGILSPSCQRYAMRLRWPSWHL